MKSTSIWYDKLLLISPVTWFGALEHMQKSPFTKANPRKLIKSVISLVLPFLCLRFLNDNENSRHLKIFFVGRTIQGITSTIFPQAYLIALACSTYIKFRQPALPEALDCLNQRIESGRCHHYGRFDVFLPEANDDTSAEDTIKGLILLPGALVSHVAYSQVASRLSDLGICVIVVSMEPLRMATSKLGSSKRRLAKIRRKVQRRFLLGKTVNWSIGGHSLGSFAALKLMKEDSQYQKLVLWAMNNKTSLPYILRNSSHPVLLVQGSNDPFCYMDDKALHDFRQNFPPDTRYQTIEGASHMWFASASQGDPVSMGKASISMGKQQERVAALTADFL
eukprot:CAMPEP_0194236816 /NCGR_PEP_ID=MMETSP0158-20130606/3992_1 /TAXON_ID=33649 /ORGANISM="Thalassionema nitzschioides, Strain L26-B" /LENGTH=335 /DNA_ID=CAMNT_0038970673 /DNA_START=143 /DNA_END=1150 /DNA_ORIENTATION=+